MSQPWVAGAAMTRFGKETPDLMVPPGNRLEKLAWVEERC
jgi:hypothetical protein